MSRDRALASDLVRADIARNRLCGQSLKVIVIVSGRVTIEV